MEFSVLRLLALEVESLCLDVNKSENLVKNTSVVAESRDWTRLLVTRMSLQMSCMMVNGVEVIM